MASMDVKPGELTEPQCIYQAFDATRADQVIRVSVRTMKTVYETGWSPSGH